jgi:hypothetical protein
MYGKKKITHTNLSCYKIIRIILYSIKAHVWSDRLYICVFLYAKKEVVHMESDWHWWCKVIKIRIMRMIKTKNIKLKKEGIYYELWRIWWTICTTRISRKIR